jgi:hypothetical protein
MTKIIEIPASEEEIFKSYLNIINGALSENARLTPIEILVLGKMLLIDYMYRRYPKQRRDELIFNKLTKEKIREDVYGISEASFNNILMKLRNKGCITKTSLIVSVPIKDGIIDLNFKLKIK